MFKMQKQLDNEGLAFAFYQFLQQTRKELQPKTRDVACGSDDPIRFHKSSEAQTMSFEEAVDAHMDYVHLMLKDPVDDIDKRTYAPEVYQDYPGAAPTPSSAQASSASKATEELFAKLNQQGQAPAIYEETRYDRRDYSDPYPKYSPYHRRFKKDCRFWLAGNCTSSSCQYYHDSYLRGSQPHLFKHIPCKRGKSCSDRYCVMSHK